jgi:hypothetical protein
LSSEERLSPNFKKLDVALRSIGYSFEVAVADVIDNSIDAKAKYILVRLITRRDGQLDLAIWDDGHGMNDKTLKEAMRFGADVSQELERLGKFGLGLKLASLSQAREFHVVSAKDGKLSGRAWLEHGIADDFSCTIYDNNECKQLISEAVPDRVFTLSATLVWWSHLYRVGQHHSRPEEHAQKLMHRLEHYLALAFHRFLTGKARKVNITLDIFDQAAGRSGIPITLDPLDPFSYPQSGVNEFPADMYLEGPYKNRMKIKAHIWPPNSVAPEYKLPGGANSRQGFYFYRNNRLIQGGGWNGMRESEPHSSLARIEMDIGADFDITVSLDVKKVEIQLPPDLVNAIQKAKTSSGVDFKKYLSLADDAYRKRKITNSELPLIPSDGLPSKLVEFLHSELRIKATTKHRDLKMAWRAMAEDTFFDIDRDNGFLYLNSIYRKQLLHGLTGSSADIPVLKCLLFFVLEDVLSSERMGPKIREKVDQVNRILVQAVKYERVSE